MFRMKLILLHLASCALMLAIPTLAPAATTLLASANQAGTGTGNAGAGSNSRITPNGRFVLFGSGATDLTGLNDPNSHFGDVFVRNLATGSTTLVSVDTTNLKSGNNRSFPVDITPNGRFVLFWSEATDLVPNDTNGKGDLFVRDLKARTTKLVSANATGTASGTGESSTNAAITPNGRFVLFLSQATDLVADDTNGALSDVFLRDLKESTTTLISVNSTGTASGNAYSRVAGWITPNGRCVTFESDASDLTNDPITPGHSNAFMRDLKTNITTLLSINIFGTASGNGFSGGLVTITPNCRFSSFISDASDLVPADTNGAIDLFVRDIKRSTTTLASTNSMGTASANGNSLGLHITPNGRYVAFLSEGNDLVPNDLNNAADVFVRDLKDGVTSLVSIDESGLGTGNDYSFPAAITDDGRFVVFTSAAGNLVQSDSNGKEDVFVRDLKTNTTQLISVDQSTTASANGGSLAPDLNTPGCISKNGRYVVFGSSATNLGFADANGTGFDVFIRDLK